MTWKALYVTGRPGFDQEVTNCLGNLGIHFMSGSFCGANTCLFWITDDFNLDRFKKEIGGKVIFKFRLRFFFNVNCLGTPPKKNKWRYRVNARQNQDQIFAAATKI